MKAGIIVTEGSDTQVSIAPINKRWCWDQGVILRYKEHLDSGRASMLLEEASFPFPFLLQRNSNLEQLHPDLEQLNSQHIQQLHPDQEKLHNQTMSSSTANTCSSYNQSMSSSRHMQQILCQMGEAQKILLKLFYFDIYYFI